MKAKPHPKYRPSGVEWLGEVPENWEVKRLKMAVELSDKKVEADEESPVPYIGLENIESWTGRLMSINPDLVPSGVANAFKKGNVLFGKLRPYLAKACTPDFDGLCSTELLVLQGHDLDRHSLRYTLLSEGFIDLVDSSTYGSKMPRANWSFIGDCVIPVPSPVEQTAIAGYLDRETGRIDELVGKKRDLIERLKEKRTALISRTVTQGLPATLPPETLIRLEEIAGETLTLNPPLKSSGIDWLGDVPDHWDVVRFRRLIAKLDQGWSPNANNYPAPADELGVLKLGAANKGRFYPERNKALDEIPNGIIPLTPARGDLLLSRANTPDLVGDACIVRRDYPKRIIPDLLYRIRIRQDIFGQFICWFLLSCSGRAQIECDARGSSSSMVKLGQGHVQAWMISLPSRPEQRAIAAYLDEETAKIDALIAKVEIAIERLHEYRTALITATVTGKIDVRKEAES